MNQMTEFDSLKINRSSEIIDNIFANMKMNLENRAQLQLHHDNGSYKFVPIRFGHIYSIFSELHEVLSKRRYKMYDPRRPYISYYDDKKVKFLDAGCGIGNVLLVASHFGLGNQFIGLEYYDKVADAAEMFLGLKNKNRRLKHAFEIRRHDITKYRHYGLYDFIYYFRPLSDHDKEVAFERQVEDQMKVGAIIIAAMKRDSRIEKDNRFKKILACNGENVWEKVSKCPT
jgi:SAM-dependent methyltransferase